MKRIGFLLGAALILSTACGGDSTSPGGSSGGSDFDITIGSGRSPTYTWPGGAGFSVSVVRVSAPTTIVWGIANIARTMQSPVTHGTTPAGSVISASTEPTLTAGVAYRVSITRADTKTGFKEFTP